MTALSPEARERLRPVSDNTRYPDWAPITGSDGLHFGDLRALLADSDALAAAERERDESRKVNAALNRRAQAAESAGARMAKIEQRIAEHERGKPLGRIEGAFAIAAAETDRDALRAQVAALRERDEARAHVAQVEDALYACFVQLLTWFKTVDGDDWGGVAMRSTDFALRLAERAMPGKCVRAAPASTAPERAEEDK